MKPIARDKSTKKLNKLPTEGVIEMPANSNHLNPND
jgi:hypothetical protein